ncbi:MAG: hypothetical protein H0T62_10855 [Parachlamydiaceae bacterium]|nr:hypothetical protein [Parachlamydiaceae bacterium]
MKIIYFDEGTRDYALVKFDEYPEEKQIKGILNSDGISYTKKGKSYAPLSTIDRILCALAACALSIFILPLAFSSGRKFVKQFAKEAYHGQEKTVYYVRPKIENNSQKLKNEKLDEIKTSPQNVTINKKAENIISEREDSSLSSSIEEKTIAVEPFVIEPTVVINKEASKKLTLEGSDSQSKAIEEKSFDAQIINEPQIQNAEENFAFQKFSRYVGGKENFENLPLLDFSKLPHKFRGGGYPDMVPPESVTAPIMRGINGFEDYEYLILKYVTDIYGVGGVGIYVIFCAKDGSQSAGTDSHLGQAKSLEMCSQRAIGSNNYPMDKVRTLIKEGKLVNDKGEIVVRLAD